MTEQTADDALAAACQLEREIWPLHAGFFWHSRDRQIIADFLARRDRETWNRAIEATRVKACDIGVSYGEDETGWFECTDTIATAIASLKDQGHG